MLKEAALDTIRRPPRQSCTSNRSSRSAISPSARPRPGETRRRARLLALVSPAQPLAELLGAVASHRHRTSVRMTARAAPAAGVARYRLPAASRPLAACISPRR